MKNLYKLVFAALAVTFFALALRSVFRYVEVKSKRPRLHLSAQPSFTFLNL